MDKRRALLIGAGGWGGVHLRALAASRRWSVGAVADTNPHVPEGVRQIAPRAMCFSDAHEAIDQADCDAVIVAVPNPRRVPILIHALERGLPTLAEKPLVHSRDDLRRVASAAKRSGSPLMVAQNYRFEPQTRRLGEFLRERRPWGALLSAHVDFRRSIRALGDHPVRRMSGGIGLLAEMCIHHFDLMRFALGENPATIRARARRAPRSAMRGWGTVDASLEFPGGALVTYHADYEVAVDRTPWGGHWEMDLEGGSLTWQPYAGGEPPLALHSPLRGRWPLDVTSRNPRDLFTFHLVDRVHSAFADALDAGREPECGLADNMQSLAIVWAVMRAAQSGRAVDFPKFLREVKRACL